MTDEIEKIVTKPVESKDDMSDGHSAKIPVDNYHFNTLELVQNAAQKFFERTGKIAKYLYAPEALMYLIDQSIRTAARNAGIDIPRGAAVVNIFDLDMIVVPGTCVTLTAEPIHDIAPTPPNIPVPESKAVH